MLRDVSSPGFRSFYSFTSGRQGIHRLDNNKYQLSACLYTLDSPFFYVPYMTTPKTTTAKESNNYLLEIEEKKKKRKRKLPPDVCQSTKEKKKLRKKIIKTSNIWSHI